MGILAQDGGDPALSTQMTVKVNILRDDGVLQCSKEYTTRVSENDDVGDRVIEVKSSPNVIIQ